MVKNGSQQHVLGTALLFGVSFNVQSDVRVVDGCFPVKAIFIILSVHLNVLV